MVRNTSLVAKFNSEVVHICAKQIYKGDVYFIIFKGNMYFIISSDMLESADFLEQKFILLLFQAHRHVYI